jgi:hypothetical protein
VRNAGDEVFEPGIEGVVDADANPGPQLEQLDAVLHSEVESEVRREARPVPRTHEIEHLVDRGVRQTAPPVEQTEPQPVRRRHCPPAREEAVRYVSPRRGVFVLPKNRSHDRVIEEGEGVEIGPGHRPDVGSLQVEAGGARELQAELDFAVSRSAGTAQLERRVGSRDDRFEDVLA